MARAVLRLVLGGGVVQVFLVTWDIFNTSPIK